MAENPSNTAQFNPAVTFIITQIFKDLGVIDEEETPSNAQVQTALFSMNSIVKTLEATGIHVWTEEEAMLFLQTDQARYIFSGTLADGNAMCSQADSWFQDELQTSYPGGTYVLELPGFAAYAVGDNIGIVLDAEVIFWTTIGGSDPLEDMDGNPLLDDQGNILYAAQVNFANGVGLSRPLPSSASVDNFVFVYPPSAQVMRPLQVPRARLYTYASGLAGQGIVTPMTILSRQEYFDLPNQLQPGTPSQWFYNPRRSDGWLYFWLPPQQPAWGSRFTYYRSIQDFLNVANTVDFPQEWIHPLRWITAKDLAPSYSVPPAKWQIIKDNYAESMSTVVAYDRESEPVQFGMDWEHR